MFSFLSESTPSTMDVSSFKGFLSYLCKLDVGGGGGGEKKKRVLYRNLILSSKGSHIIYLRRSQQSRPSNWFYLFLFFTNIFTKLYRHVAIIDNVKALVKCSSYHLFTWPDFAHSATRGHLHTRIDFLLFSFSFFLPVQSLVWHQYLTIQLQTRTVF